MGDGPGTISGIVIDNSTGTGIESVSISLYSIDDSSNVVTGTNTDVTGNFTLDDVPYGQYYLSVNFIGFSTVVVRGITLAPEGKEVSLDEIKLKPGETETEEIVVEDEKSDIQFTAEKKIFNVSKDETTRGGDALDVLKNIPSVTVDQDGNVSLRGSEGVRLLIDGKSFGLDGPNRPEILRAISADNIESIELITNPSAKYKAEGVTGIINIITKKNEDSGYNANLSLNLGTGDKYRGGLNVNWKKNRLNIFVDYNYSNRFSTFERTSSREVFFETGAPYYDSDQNSTRRRISNYVRGGLDYTIDKLNSIAIVNSYRNGKRTYSGAQTNLEYDINRNLTNNYITNTSSYNDGFDYDVALNYYRNFSNPKQSLTGELEFHYEKDDENTSSSNISTLPGGPKPYRIQEFEDDKEIEVNLALDYVHPVGEDSKFEAGYSGEIKDDKDGYTYEYFDYTNNQYVNDTTRTNIFNLDRQVQAGYLLFNSGIGENFTYQLGLRTEYTNRTGTLELTGQAYDKNFLDFFPSVSLAQKLGLEEEVQFSYSRRIRRPRSRYINPFPRFRGGNDRSVFAGNPDVNPEYTNSFEMSFVKFFTSTSIVPSVFYRKTKDAITRTTSFIDSVTTLTTFTNSQEEETYGAELIVNSKLFPWLSLNSNISYYHVSINAENIEPGLTNENSTYSGRLAVSFRFPDLFNLQLSYFHSGERTTPQGSIDPFRSLSASISRDFFDGRATLGFNVRDIFNNSEFNIQINDPKYVQSLLFKRESRVANLVFRYRFGEQGKDKKKRRGRQESDDDGDFGF